MTDWLLKAEKAVEYLQQSEQQWAENKALLKFQSERHKAILARLQNDAPGDSEAARKRHAEADKAFQDAINESVGIATKFYLLDAKRQRAEYVIEMFRSVNSAQKRGNP